MTNWFGAVLYYLKNRYCLEVMWEMQLVRATFGKDNIHMSNIHKSVNWSSM